MSLPYSDTSVPVSRSQSQVKSMLIELCECMSVIEATTDGRTQIVAVKDGLTYLYECDRDFIAKKVSEFARCHTPVDEKLKQKADRIGWRIIWHEVKHMATCVQYGLFSMERAFANHLVSVDKTGKLDYFGDIAADAIKSGKISNGNIAQALLPQNTGGSE